MVNRRQLSVRNGVFNTEVREAGQGEPVLYLHNMAIQDQGWDPFIDKLGEQFQVIAPLHPGFGGSEGGDHIDEVIDIVTYYNDFLDAAGVREPVNVVGHELGGMFAAELAAMSPHRVKKLVLSAPYGLWLEDMPSPNRFATPFRMLREMLWHDASNAAAGGYQIRPRDPAGLEEYTVQEIRALSSGSKFLWQFPDRGLEKRIHRIAAPTLVLWGESDGMIPPIYGEAYKAAIKGAQLQTIPETGHLPMLETPDAYVAALAKFLK